MKKVHCPFHEHLVIYFHNLNINIGDYYLTNTAYLKNPFLVPDTVKFYLLP
jgi:hypothetical protein